MSESDVPESLQGLDIATQAVVMLATAYVAVRSALGPDTVRMVQAGGLRFLENYCQRQAVTWARLADVCKAAYDQTRLVV